MLKEIRKNRRILSEVLQPLFLWSFILEGHQMWVRQRRDFHLVYLHSVFASPLSWDVWLWHDSVSASTCWTFSIFTLKLEFTLSWYEAAESHFKTWGAGSRQDWNVRRSRFTEKQEVRETAVQITLCVVITSPVYFGFTSSSLNHYFLLQFTFKCIYLYIFIHSIILILFNNFVIK